jgi:Tfp pilus assembly protein PilX
LRTERAGRESRRGSILVHVLLTGIVVALIAATLLRMALLRYQMGARGAAMLVAKRADQSALAEVMTMWNVNNATCSNLPAGQSNYSCVPGAPPTPPGVCGCTCSPLTQTSPPTLPQVVAAPDSSGNCALSIVSF